MLKTNHLASCKSYLMIISPNSQSFIKSAIRSCGSQLKKKFKITTPASTQLTHNVFKTLLESCAELVWDKRCSNIVATFDQIYFVWQCRWHKLSIERTHCIYKANYTKICKICVLFSILKMINIKRCYSVAETLSYNIQRCSNVIWHHFHHFGSTLPLNVVAMFA